MTLEELVMRNRSYRRFDTNGRIANGQLLGWLDVIRRTASGRNMQSLKYALSYDEETNGKIFAQLKWAGYLPDWNPSESEQPAAYVVFCNDSRLSAATPQIDLGIQAQTLLLAAAESGYGGCMLLAFNKERISEILSLPANLTPCMVVALGLPAERCVIEPLPDTGDIRYYRDADGVHHVPKRSLADLVV